MALQFNARPPPGLAPCWSAVSAVSSCGRQACGVGPPHIESDDAWNLGVVPGDTGVNQVAPPPRRDEPTSSREDMHRRATEKFKSRCAFAMRQFKRDAPSRAILCRDPLTKLLHAAGGIAVETQGGGTTGGSSEEAICYDMAATDAPAERRSYAEKWDQRFDDIEEKLQDLTLAIVNCPVGFVGQGRNTTVTEDFVCDPDAYSAHAPLAIMERQTDEMDDIHKDITEVAAIGKADALLATTKANQPLIGETISADLVVSTLTVPCDSVAEFRTGTVHEHVCSDAQVSQLDKGPSDSVAEFRLGKLSLGQAIGCIFTAPTDTLDKEKLFAEASTRNVTTGFSMRQEVS